MLVTSMKVEDDMIRKDVKSRLVFITLMIVIWIIAWDLFYILRHLGIEEYPYVNIEFIPHHKLQLLVHSTVGIVTGILYGSSEILFEQPRFHKISYGRVIIIKTLFYSIVVVLLMSIAILLSQKLLFAKLDWDKLIWWLNSKSFLVAILHFLTVSILISFIRQMNYKFGPGVLWNMLIGKYHKPREEERIFMFLDLKSSTRIAEKLGHIRFSELIQDCFADLTDVILEHHVDIYQYVGDEAVLSWKPQKGMEQNHCLQCYFDFLDILQSKSAYYQDKYNLVPFFKAGVHVGKVTVAEVGVVKREIAYHGDVLNTTARIQSRCNALNKGLLISGELHQRMDLRNTFTSAHMSFEVLRGKQSGVSIFSIEKIDGHVGTSKINDGKLAL